MRTWCIAIVVLAIIGLVVPLAHAQKSYTRDMIDKVEGSGSSGHNLTSVKDEGDEVIITITNVRLTPIGRDTKGKDLVTPKTIELYSAIMDGAGEKTFFISAPVINGTVTFRIPNSAKTAKAPIPDYAIDHIWGRGNGGKMALVHDPADPWVCYKMKDGKPDLDYLDSLAIGLAMYKNGPTKPLMSLGKGKLDQGKYFFIDSRQ